MRPVLLEFEGFGPYIEKQTVDFESLDKNGIILIGGETGAGKTTLLDAICCALFGKASGSKGSFFDMRCKQAADDVKTRVSFIFDTADSRYKFEREIVKKRVNLTDNVNCLRYENGVFVPLLANPTATKVNKRAEEILCLTYDQFRQVIMLPQGEFETFLTSASDEKQAVLERLFNTEYIEKTIALVLERVREQRAALTAVKSEIDAFLSKNGCEDMGGVDLLIAGREEELAENGKALARLNAQKAVISKAYEEAMKANEKFISFEAARNNLNAVNSQRAVFDKKKSTLALYKEAARLTPIYGNYEEKKKALEACDRTLKAETAKLNFKKTEAAGAAEKLNAHIRQEDQFNKNAGEIVLLNSKRELYGKIDGEKRRLDELERKVKRAELEAEAKRKAFEAAVSEYNTAEARATEATEAFNSIRRQYIDGFRGALAKELVENQPCPVCGSLTHPSPAVSDGSDISKERVDEQENIKNAAERGEKEKRSTLEAARESRDSAAKDYERIKKDRDIQKSNYDNYAGQTVEGIDSLEKLNGKINALEKFNSGYTAAKKELQAAVDGARAEVSRLEGAVSGLKNSRNEAEAKADEAKKMLEAELENSSFCDIEAYKKYLVSEQTTEALSNEINDYEIAVKSAADNYSAIEKEISGLTRPNLKELEAEKREADSKTDVLNRKIGSLESGLEELKKEYEGMKAKKTDYDREIVISDENITFAKRLRGDNSIGLQRYILGVMLTHITVEANQLLKNVHGGRYQLLRTDESHGGSRLKGLELEVYDAYSDVTRAVKTLSGGEKFLVSLCLAIGLTAVVQSKGNIKLGAMFVDEGFGTLDDKSIDDALEVLNGIKNNNVTVAVISHHSKLASVISNKIRVSKSQNGSKLIY